MCHVHTILFGEGEPIRSQSGTLLLLPAQRSLREARRRSSGGASDHPTASQSQGTPQPQEGSQASGAGAEAEAVGGADREDPSEEMEEMVSKASMHMLSCTCTCCHAVHVMGGEPIRLWRSSGNRLGCGGGTGNRLGCGVAGY